MPDLWKRIPPGQPLPVSYAQVQKQGVAVAGDELVYRTGTPLAVLLEARYTLADCPRFTRLESAQKAHRTSISKPSRNRWWCVFALTAF